MKNQRIILIASITIAVASITLTGCSTTPTKETGTLVANDEIMQGPGMFSGKKGVFYLVGGNSPAPKKTTYYKSNTEVMQVINKKIKQLDKDKAELEQLKTQLKNR